MKRVFLAVTVIICAFSVAVVGCSSGGTATNANEDSYKGFWAIEDESLGFTAALSLEEESFAGLLVSDSYFEGTWVMDGSNVKITLEDASATPVSAHLDGDKLILGSEQGSHLVFKKSSEEEYYGDTDVSGGELSSASSEEAALFEDVEIVDEKIDDIQPVSVADDSVVKIEATGKGTDFTSDPGYRLSITNKTKKSFFIGATGPFKVNGKELEAGLGDVIEAGETVETFIYFDKNELGGSVEALKDVEGTIVVFDEETEKELGSYTFKMS